jgi:peptidyl-prolyl cis-trans isomerase B (cyclophilin B)
MKLFTVIALLGLLIGCGDSQQPANSEDVTSDVTSDAKPPADTVDKKMVDKTDPDWKSNVTAPEMMTFEPGKTYTWVLETNIGSMTFRLFHEESPMHVNSTIYLTELGFYDDVIFHRVIPGFMAQGGDPTGTGRGGPDYKYAGEFAPGLSHTKPGLLSMANAGPGTDGSQFFITFLPTPFLDGKHTIFGELTSGAEILAALEARGSRSGKTSEMLKIIQATILIE